MSSQLPLVAESPAIGMRDRQQLTSSSLWGDLLQSTHPAL